MFHQLWLESRRSIAAVHLIALMVSFGCTDWDAGAGLGAAGPNLGPGVTRLADAADFRADGSNGIVYVDGWNPPLPDAATDFDSATEPSFDAGGLAPDSAPLTDDTALSPDGRPATDLGTAADSTAADSTAADSTAADSTAADSTATGDAGLDTSPNLEDVSDGQIHDSNDGAVDAAQVTDGATQLDAGGTPDAAVVADTTVPTDVAVLPDVGVPDVGVPDTTTTDIGPLADTPQIFDITDTTDTTDTAQPMADAWPWWTPDWIGYADVAFPDDVDIYGGVISSCFNLYTYAITEACAFPELSGACIDTAAKDGSYYSRYLFAPLQGCMKQNCVPKCKADADPKCVEKCLGKSCATPFFACIAQGETGSNDCPTTFSCLTTYKDKLFSIATKCFANATTTAQNQLATFFACGEKPQTEGCIDQIAACYGPPGKLSCLEAIQCADKTCAKGDEVCGFKCIGQGTPSAIAKLDALWECSLKKCGDCNGPNGCGDACIGKQCKAEQIACAVD